MTGAPLYLVSACTTGEEFVAAFRRYADKKGLFVPISEPFPVGYRARIAVTLKDGGVMIEGDAEVIAAARTVSVVHGRVGMTLRFLEPDPSSQTMLSELERARLAMKPAPPSISPRPAEIPAEPRPVPPPVQGRIDAVNALAECVAIGATGIHGSTGGPTTMAPAMPPKAGARMAVPAVVPRTTAAGSGGGTPRAAAPTSPRSILPMMDPGPASDTLVAARPPAPPTPPSTTIPDPSPPPLPSSAPAPTPRVPMSPSAPPASPERTSPAAPTRHAAEMAVVVPRTATRPGHAPASAHDRSILGLGLGHGPGSDPRSDAGTAVPTQSTTPQSAPTDIGGLLVEPLPPTESPSAPNDDPTIDLDVDVDADAVFGPATDPALGARLAATTDPVIAPATKPPIQIVASTTERDDPSARTQVHAGVPPREPGVGSAGRSPQVASPPPNAVLAMPEVELAEPTDLSVGPPMPVPELRRTVQGVAVAQTASLSQPLAPVVDDLTPIDWAMAHSTAGGSGAAAPSEPPSAIPNGDWTIALDPQSLDGWSEPFATIPPHDLAAPMAPPQRGTQRPDGLPMVEPKVQIDPTLIEPLIDPRQAGEPVPVAYGALGAMYGGSGAGVLEARPAIAMTPPGAFMLPHGQLMTPAEAPAYEMNPGYQMAPMGAPSPGAVVGFSDAQYTSRVGLPARTSRRRVVIVIATAAVAVAIGIAVLAALTSGRDSGADSGAASGAGAVASGTKRPPPPVVAPPTASEPASAAPEAPPPPSPDPGAATPPAAVEAATPPPPSTCFAELFSNPAGAEIVIDQTKVLGTTPARIPLPCSPVELVFRKGRLAQVTRTVRPTPGGVKLKVTLVRQSVLVRVSSTPEGATITLNGKPLGVTPTTVRVPAFESSSLLITKDGYEHATEAVTPKSSGATIRTRLKKLDGS